jgi:hypothetical protein
MEGNRPLPAQSPRWNEAQVEASIVSVTETMREMTRLLRAMAPMVEELRTLQELARQWQTLNLNGLTHLLENAAPRSVAESVSSPREEQLPHGAPAHRLEEQIPPTAASPPERRPRTIEVTIARIEGPIEPARISRALSLLSGVSGVALVRQERGQVTLAIDIDRPPRDLPLNDALATVFGRPVNGEWRSETEFLAIISGPTGLARDT